MKVESHVCDALAQGAEIVARERRHAPGGSFYEPTVFTGAKQAMPHWAGRDLWTCGSYFQFLD